MTQFEVVRVEENVMKKVASLYKPGWYWQLEYDDGRQSSCWTGPHKNQAGAIRSAHNWAPSHTSRINICELTANGVSDG